MPHYHKATNKRAKIGDTVEHEGSRGTIAGLSTPSHHGALVAIEWVDGSVSRRILPSSCGLFHSSSEPNEKDMWQ